MLRGVRRLKRTARRLVQRDRPVILCYHRVATVTCDPWMLAVRPERFAEQIEALVQERRIVPLSWLARELAQGRVPKRTAAITFDDGYADVVTNAWPILERFGCPATAFLTTGPIGRAEPFWWDELAHIVLTPQVLPPALAIEIGGRRHSWCLSDDPARGASDESVIGSQELHLALWALLRPLCHAERTEHLGSLADWAGIERLSPTESRAMSAEEVRRLVGAGLVDIGAHTITHPSLPLLEAGCKKAEVEESRRACEALVGVPIDGFAYPFGDHDAASTATVRSAGFVYACTTEHGTAGARSDLLRLPRAVVGDWSGDALIRWFSRLPAAPSDGR